MKKFVCILLVLVMVFAMSAVAFADNAVSPEHSNTDVNPNNNPNAPQTSDTNTIFVVVAALVAAIGLAVFCGKKLIIQK